MNIDQLLRDSAPDPAEMQRHADRLRPDVVARFETTPATRGRRRWVAGAVAAAAAATAYVVISPAGPAVSPAYAVTQEADGDVVVTIHQLEDSQGLEEELQALGIDAHVKALPFVKALPSTDDSEVTLNAVGGPVWILNLDPQPFKPSDEVPTEPACGPAYPSPPATLHHSDGDWVLRIPAASELHDLPVLLMAGPDGTLAQVAWTSDLDGSTCVLLAATNL
jgi:hypothetical protein